MNIDIQGTIIFFIGFVLVFVIVALISSVVISGIINVYSMIGKKESFAFGKVFPYVFISHLILFAIYIIFAVFLRIK